MGFPSTTRLLGLLISLIQELKLLVVLEHCEEVLSCQKRAEKSPSIWHLENC
jgi:hypothetical protein